MIYWARKYFTNGSAHFAAFYEVLITAIFSVGPLYIAYFVQSARNPNGTFADIGGIAGRGQLFLLAYGVFGVVFWLAFMKSDRPRHGARAFLGVVATLLILPVVGFLGVDPSFETILNEQVVNYGYVLYGLLLFINYLLLFYLNIEPPPASSVFSREALTMRERYNAMEGRDD